MSYFFDTYALLRVHFGEPAYAPFADVPIVTERSHVFEFAREVMKQGGGKAVLPAIASLRANRLDPTDADLLAAAKLKVRHPRLSSADAIGYVLAQREGLKLLTGDTAFRKMRDVEFVRAP